MAAFRSPFFMDEPVQEEPTVYTEDPFSYNFIALKKSEVNRMPTPAEQDVIANPTYNLVGKALGIKDQTGWSRNYDKVYLITEWAKERTGYNDPDMLLAWIKKASKYAFILGGKRIDNLFNKIRRIDGS